MAILDGIIGCWSPSLGATGYRLLDRTKYGNHGTLTGMDAGTDWVASPIGLTLDFDGSNDYISAPNVQAFASGTQLTASIWVKRGATGTTHCLIGKWLSTATSNEDGWLLRWNNANLINLSIANSGSYGILSSSSAYTSTEWVHIAAVHEFGSSSKSVIYLNGSPIAATWTGGGTQVPDSDATSAPITVGALRYQGGPLQYLTGRLGEFAVFKRCLTATELLRLYTSGSGWIGRELTGMNRRRRYGRAAGFKAAWAMRQRQILGGGGGLG